MMNNKDKYLSKKNQLSKIITNLLSFSDDLKHRDNQYVWLDDFVTKLEEVEKKLKTQTFKVAVMAMMKSGKSTLINAILGNEFLPSANSAETLEVIQIEHDEQYKQGTLFGSNDEILAVSPANIKAKIRELNLLGRELNKSNQSQLLLRTDIQSFKKESGSDVKFVILDTPGSNEKLIVINNSIKHLINTTDVIIYLLDFEKLDFESGENIFEELKQLRTNLISDDSRLFFVINKIDELNSNDKEKGITNKEDIVKKVKDKYLKKDFEDHIVRACLKICSIKTQSLRSK